MEDYLRESVSNGIDSLNVVARFGTTTAVKEGIKAGLGLIHPVFKGAGDRAESEGTQDSATKRHSHVPLLLSD